MLLEYFKKGKEILGMNARNLEYIRPFNLSRAKRLADNKLLSKKVLAKNKLAVPKLLAKITSYEELEKFDWSSLPESFCLKPNNGYGGEGIIVVYGKKKGHDDIWIRANKTLISVSDLKSHIRNILDGSFALSGTPDTAFFEERLQLLKLFKPYSYKGIPDIRVIVFKKVPVMAMLRLPTEASNGKANLQQGAIGVGIDLTTGTTTTSVLGKNRMVEYVPNSRLLLSGIKIPRWKDILTLSIRAQEISRLGFLGVDIAIDKERGPVILELNARPGLSIQIANLSGLKRRLEKIKDLKIKTLEKGLRVGMDLFGGEVEEGVEGLSGRRVIGTVEKVKLVGKDGKEIEVEAKIDTGAYSTSIDTELAKQLGYEDVLNYFNSLELPQNFSREEVKKIEEDLRKKYLGQHPDLADISAVYSSHGVSIRPKINIKIIMDETEIFAKANVAERSELKRDILIGRQNLGKFLIDVNKLTKK